MPTTTLTWPASPVTITGPFLTFTIGGEPTHYNNGTPYSFDFVANGTDCQVGIYDFGSFQYSIDGGAAQTNSVGSAALKLITLFTGLSDGPHTVSIWGTAQNFYRDNNFFIVTGAAPSITRAGTSYRIKDYESSISLDGSSGYGNPTSNQWYSEAYNGNGSLLSFGGTGGGSIRFRATAEGLRVFGYQKYGLRVAVDGVETGTTYTPAAEGWGWLGVGSSYDGTADHEYRITCIGGQSWYHSVHATGTGTINTSSAVTGSAWAFFGDSITAGYPLNNGSQTFAYQVAVAKSVGIRNMGIGGTTVAATGGSNSGQSRTAQITGLTPSVGRVVILYGTNDPEKFGAGETTTDYQPAYEAMLQSLIDGLPSGTPIDCLAMLPTSDVTRSSYRSQILGWTSAAVASKSAANAGTKIRYIDTTGWIIPATDTSDGLHPNATGHAKIATAYLATFASRPAILLMP